MQFLVALLIFVLVFVVVKFSLSKVDPLAKLPEIIGIVAGGLGALYYLGAI